MSFYFDLTALIKTPTDYDLIYKVGWVASAFFALQLHDMTVFTFSSAKSRKAVIISIILLVTSAFAVTVVDKELFLTEKTSNYTNPIPFPLFRDKSFDIYLPGGVLQGTMTPEDYSRITRKEEYIVATYVTIVIHFIFSCLLVGSFSWLCFAGIKSTIKSESKPSFIVRLYRLMHKLKGNFKASLKSNGE